MSASREKKQRHGTAGQNKPLTAAEQAAAAKRKTVRYTAIGVVIAVLVAALLFWDSGFLQRRSTAVTIGSTDYSAAEVTYYYNSIYQQVALYAQYGLNTYDLTLSPDEQTYSYDSETGAVITYDDYFRDYAVEQLTTITALYDAALADGYTESDVAETVDSEMDAIAESATSNGYSSTKQLLTTYYGKLVTPKVYRGIVTRQALASLYLDDYTNTLEYSDAELNAYYEENADNLDTIEYSFLYFKAASVDSTDEDGNELSEDEVTAAEEQALADAKSLAEQAMQSILDGADPADVADELDATSSSLNNALLGASVNANLSDWLLDSSRTAGDVEVIAYSDYGYYVAIFENRYLDETPSVDVRHILISAEIDEDADEPTPAQMLSAKATAEQLLSDWQSGDATEDAFAALAEEYSTDSGSNTNGGLYEGVFPGDFVTNFDNWLFHEDTRAVGDVNVIENNGDSGYYGYHIVYLSAINEGDYEWKTTARSTLADEDVEAWLETLTSPLSVTEKSGMNYLG